MKTGMELIQAERARQVAVEGFLPEHDDVHKCGEMACAAGCYLLQARELVGFPGAMLLLSHTPWPWEQEWWKPSKEPVRNLEKAGALYLAEMERLDRLGVNSAHVLLWVKQVAAEIDFLNGGFATDSHGPAQTGPVGVKEVPSQVEPLIRPCGLPRPPKDHEGNSQSQIADRQVSDGEEFGTQRPMFEG